MHRVVATRCQRTDVTSVNNDDILDDNDDNEGRAITPTTVRGKKRLKGRGKTVIIPHKKKGRIRSNLQAQSSMADSIRKLVESQDKRWKQGIAEDKKRDEMFLKFKENEAAKNRQHELAMAQIFAAAFSQSKPQETVSIAQREVPITPSSSTPYQTPGRFQRAPTGPYTSFLRQPFPGERYADVGGRIYENLGRDGGNASPELF